LLLTFKLKYDIIKFMYRGNSSRIFPIIIILVIVVIAIVALVSVGRAIFGGDQNQAPSPTDTSRSTLLKTNADNSVRMTVRGPIVADEAFRSYRIVISPSDRTLTTYSGYMEQPLKDKQLSNNVKSYEEFVYALERANLADGAAFTGEKDDTRGICATGRVYEFEIMQSGSVVKRLWTSTCKGSPGSLKASSAQLQKLFLDQIPDHKDLLDRSLISGGQTSLF
jgi:hypothetical protein